MKRCIGRLVLLAVLAGLLQGCDTMAAFGRDVQTLGTSIEKKADDKKAEQEKNK